MTRRYVPVWTPTVSGQDIMSISANFMQNEISLWRGAAIKESENKVLCHLGVALSTRTPPSIQCVSLNYCAAFWLSLPCGAEEKIKRKPKSTLNSKFKPDELFVISKEEKIDFEGEAQSRSTTFPPCRKHGTHQFVDGSSLWPYWTSEW